MLSGLSPCASIPAPAFVKEIGEQLRKLGAYLTWEAPLFWLLVLLIVMWGLGRIYSRAKGKE